jgi:hypothetical protein
VGEHKKYSDERLQETRTKHLNKVRYQRRVQQEKEAEEELKEYTKHRDEDNEDR